VAAALLTFAQVYGELLSALESPAAGLLGLESAIEQMLSSLDGCRPEELLQCIDYKASQEGEAVAASSGEAA
jgi:hypothetical protein